MYVTVREHAFHSMAKAERAAQPLLFSRCANTYNKSTERTQALHRTVSPGRDGLAQKEAQIIDRSSSLLLNLLDVPLVEIRVCVAEGGPHRALPHVRRAVSSSRHAARGSNTWAPATHNQGTTWGGPRRACQRPDRARRACSRGSRRHPNRRSAAPWACLPARARHTITQPEGKRDMFSKLANPGAGRRNAREKRMGKPRPEYQRCGTLAAPPLGPRTHRMQPATPPEPC